MQIKNLTLEIIFLAIVFLGLFGLVGKSRAATISAVSCSLANVATAYNASKDGDTVEMPSGSCTWTSTLTVAKAVTIKGAESGSTVITTNGVAFLFNPGSNKAFRLTDVGFIGGNNTVTVKGSMNNGYVLDQFRIDHCTFTGGNFVLLMNGWLEGVIDNNTLTNASGIYMVGDNDYAWQRTIAAGTSHALFIEDNSFFQKGGTELYEQIYHWAGSRSVIRHNLFDGSASSASFSPFDSHGNQPYYVGAGKADRGQPIIEVYENVFTYQSAYKIMYIRGGSSLIWNNQFNYSGNSDIEIQLAEEESWRTDAGFETLRTTWPAQDQVANTFIWGNTRNGSALTVDRIDVSGTAFVRENRDFFMHAPQPFGGQTIYTGAHKGGSTSAPTDGSHNFSYGGVGYFTDNGNTTFNTGLANAYYPYSPYAYPHPLRNGTDDTTPPAAPTGLIVS